MRNGISAAVAAALCTLPAAPAPAQEHLYSGFDAPRGAAATLNVRVPLGADRGEAAPTYGLTVGYGRNFGPTTIDGRRTETRAMRFADIRFAGGELRTARVASFDLANLDRDRRLNIANEISAKNAFVGILILAATGIFVCAAFTRACFGGGDDTSTPPPYTPPGE